MTFFGQSRVEHDVEHHIHESPSSMTIPLIILAALSFVGGWIGWPASLGGSDRFAHFLEPVMGQRALEITTEAEKASRGANTIEYLLMLASVLIALTGIGLAYRWYIKSPERPERFAARMGGLYRLVLHKYYVDEIYDALFVNRTKDLGTALGAFDRGVIGGAGVNGVGLLTRVISRISMWWDKWIVDGLVGLSARIVWVFSFVMRLVQTGYVSGYALFIVMGLIALLGYYLHLVRLPVH
jgi:NADH-quinone oxidoreductase subunit L